MIAAGSAPSAHIEVRILLTWFQTGAVSLVVDGVLVASAVAYLGAAGLRPARSRYRQGRSWPPFRTAAFLAGLGSVFVAVSSGLAAYDDVNPSAHVLQHVLLMMVAAPLLVAGQPLILLARVGPRRLQLRVLRVTGGWAASIVTGPLAWALYLGSMAGYFLTPLYPASVRNQVLHDGLHGWFLAAGYLYWTGILGPDSRWRRRSEIRRAISVLAGMPIESAIGLALIVWPRPLAPGNSLHATHAAGVLFWMASMATSGVSIAALAHRWIRSDERRVHRASALVPSPSVSRPADAGP